MSLKALIKFNNKTSEANSEIHDFVDRAVGKATLTAQRNVMSETPVVHGNLRRSIQSRFPGFGKGEVFSSTNGKVDVGYAVFVEYGTKYFAPRAMFRKGIEKSKDEIKKIFSDEAKNVKLTVIK